MSCPNPIPPMTEEERAAFRSFLPAAMSSASWPWSWASPGRCCLRRGVDGPPLMEAVWVCLFVLSGGTAVLGGQGLGPVSDSAHRAGGYGADLAGPQSRPPDGGRPVLPP